MLENLPEQTEQTITVSLKNKKRLEKLCTERTFDEVLGTLIDLSESVAQVQLKASRLHYG